MAFVSGTKMRALDVWPSLSSTLSLGIEADISYGTRWVCTQIGVRARNRGNANVLTTQYLEKSCA